MDSRSEYHIDTWAVAHPVLIFFLQLLRRYYVQRQEKDTFPTQCYLKICERNLER
jgi:hypothetical protein